ncbi:MAG: RecQ family ATP-dependent DNA helicase [Prevotellaceae bacterium]|jgi:ATP-dependent DNA helicase RecQ|nr:RecQ family ATP-dependent DNA helicase [Prevotellaceae bacterium]
MTYHEILKRYWGYDSFRGIQEAIIQSIGSGQDTLGLMPTGGGKSITFQVPALALEGMCLVITPLIALMRDQVQQLRHRGIRALAIYSGMSHQEMVVTLENCIYGNYKFLYISPERLATDLFRTKLRRMHISLMVVDESHCISQWGYDFRPSYLKISEVRTLLPGVAVLALTATATPEVAKDIQEKLHFRRENLLRMSFERENLAYLVRQTENKNGELLRILRRIDGSAIVYTHTRRDTRVVAELLNREGIPADFYHAGLDNQTRNLRQQRWSHNQIRVIVATNAFGMGIDKPDVRLVIHFHMPDSPEAYFQEAGRAGRDGLPAYAILLHDQTDRRGLNLRVSNTFPSKSYIRQIYEHLQYYYQMAMGDGQGCVREFNLDDFCRKFKHFPVQTDSALKLLTQAGYLEYTEEMENASRLHFRVGRDELYRIGGIEGAADRLIRGLLRLYTGLFTEYVFIEEGAVASHTGLEVRQVYDQLIRLTHLRIVDYIPRKKTPYIIYTRGRVEADRLVFPPAVYEERKARYAARIQAMQEYVDNRTFCRSRLLLHYFGEQSEHRCGRCDICLGREAEPGTVALSYEEIARRILSLVEETPRSMPQLIDAIAAPQASILEAIGRLDEAKRIRVAGSMVSKA